MTVRTEVWENHPLTMATKPAAESVQCFGRKKTAVAVTHCKRGCGLIKLNGCPIELFNPFSSGSTVSQAWT